MSDVESPGHRLSSSKNRRLSAESDASTETGGQTASLRSRREEVSPTARAGLENFDSGSKQLLSAWNEEPATEASKSMEMSDHEFDAPEQNESAVCSFRSRLMSTVTVQAQALGAKMEESDPRHILVIGAAPAEIGAEPHVIHECSEVSDLPIYQVFERSTLQVQNVQILIIQAHSVSFQ